MSAAGRPNANRSVVSSTGSSLVATRRPRTVPAAHSTAAPKASNATATWLNPMSSGSGNASNQAPISAGTANQAKDGRNRSCSSTAAPMIAMTGWNFWITAGVTGSPYLKDRVNSVVATADAPAPMATTATLPPGSSRPKPRNARGRNGSSTTTSTTCSANTIVGAANSRASGSRSSASVPQSAAANATTQVRSRVFRLLVVT